MSSIITRPAFEGPHPLATTAPGALAMREAQRTFDMAEQVIENYVTGKANWLGSTINDGKIALFRDGVYISQCLYGDWVALDKKIAEALARYAEKTS